MTNPDDDSPVWLGMALITLGVVLAALMFTLLGFN